MSGVPAPLPHGGDGASIAAALGLDPSTIVDLSQSLNPLARDPSPVIARHLDALARYPDPDPAADALAQLMGVDPGRLLLANGGAEAISLVAGVLGGRVVEPEFSLHPRSDDETQPLWRSNPNNPTGILVDPGITAAVWDEAFYPLATGRWTCGDPDAVVVGSLTKLLACPGLRVGYVIAGEEVLDACRIAQPAWSVNGLAVAALPELLETVDLWAWHDAVAKLRNELVDVLRGHGLDPWPSDASWVLTAAPGLREQLAPHGVIVRDCSSFAMPGIVRIAVPTPTGLSRLDDALSAIDPFEP